eukprot:181692-Amorphochlora_amoeboformis.AAC.1
MAEACVFRDACGVQHEKNELDRNLTFFPVPQLNKHIVGGREDDRESRVHRNTPENSYKLDLLAPVPTIFYYTGCNPSGPQTHAPAP